MGVADYISVMGAQVSIVTSRLFAGSDIEETCRENLNRRLARRGAKTYTSSRLVRVEGRTAVFENIFNGEEFSLKDLDTLVVAQASRSDNELYKELKKSGEFETYCVGDAAAPGTVLRIIFEAEELGRKL